MAVRTSAVTRRQMLQSAAAGMTGLGWLDILAAHANEIRTPGKRPKSCIILWTSGGFPQNDSFDMKPEAEEGIRSTFKPMKSSLPGIDVCELMPRSAEQMRNLAVIRSVTHAHTTHGGGTVQMYRKEVTPDAPARLVRPNLGSSIAAALAIPNSRLPAHILLSGTEEGSSPIGSSGFLGKKFVAMSIPVPAKALEGVRSVLEPAAFEDRLRLFEAMEKGFADAQAEHGVVNAHRIGYQQAVSFMNSEQLSVFDLSRETAKVREAFGQNAWGDGCLLASRLVESGAPFVRVGWSGALGSWDTHSGNAKYCEKNLPIFDAGFGTLIDDLKQRGLLDTTLVVCMSEFGRTPKINKGAGRDHHPKAWTILMAGAGIKAGQVLGSTTATGEEVKDRPVTPAEVFATICHALDIDPDIEFGAKTGVKLTTQMDAMQRVSAGDGVRLLGKTAKIVPELFS